MTISNLSDRRRTKAKICIRIPKDLHSEPIISRLISQYGVTVNIFAAQLGAEADSGCFELEIRGAALEIESALTYLDELDLEIFHQQTPEEDGW